MCVIRSSQNIKFHFRSIFAISSTTKLQMFSSRFYGPMRLLSCLEEMGGYEVEGDR